MQNGRNFAQSVKLGVKHILLLKRSMVYSIDTVNQRIDLEVI